jgi:hypothetical protein
VCKKVTIKIKPRVYQQQTEMLQYRIEDRSHFLHLDVNGVIILKLSVRKRRVKMWTGLVHYMGLWRACEHCSGHL